MHPSRRDFCFCSHSRLYSCAYLYCCVYYSATPHCDDLRVQRSTPSLRRVLQYLLSQIPHVCGAPSSGKWKRLDLNQNIMGFVPRTTHLVMSPITRLVLGLDPHVLPRFKTTFPLCSNPPTPNCYSRCKSTSVTLPYRSFLPVQDSNLRHPHTRRCL